MLQLEEEYIEKMCSEIIAVKPDLVITEKGVSGQLIINNINVSVEVTKINVCLLIIQNDLKIRMQ